MVPKNLETEKGSASDGRAWDIVNAERLAVLAGSK
jgi:hypothetical protein